MSKLAKGFFNAARTENGAVTHASTFDPVLDFYYHAPARRGQDNTDLFEQAYNYNSVESVLAAFYIRDARGGQGERQTFRNVLNWLWENDRNTFDRIIHLVPEYGRWDDILSFTESKRVVDIVRGQLNEDYNADHPSLLAKWMPSENASSAATRKLAAEWISALSTTPRHYRRRMSSIRAKIRIVESYMSAGKWSNIEYFRVPSRAGLIYRKAFSKHDGDRYVRYLEDVKAGKEKINASVLYPYEIIGKYLDGSEYGCTILPNVDTTLEELWKALPDYCNGNNFLVICDTSGSMQNKYIAKAPRPIDVAVSLALYSAERNKGPFNGMWINFNTVARAYRVKGNTLRARIADMYNNPDWGSTNLQSAFKLILATANQYNVPAEDMPKMLFVVSDMQFNPTGEMTNFAAMKLQYQLAGYEIPRVVFWNVKSRVTEAPVTMHETGAMLVSGCSPSVFKDALSSKATNPRELMEEMLYSNRYVPVLMKLKG